MRNRFKAGLPGLALFLAVGCAAVQPLPAGHPTGNVEVVHVAAPTGEQATDRASILAALDEVQPGGTIQFGPGTYLVGEMIRVSIPQVTLLGHPEGTILRGCEAAAYEEMMRHLSRATDWSDRWAAMSRCGLLELTGGRGTVRNLTFENTDRGLGLGCCLAEPAFRPSDGGYLIENNIFRNSRNGIRASLASADTTVIRANQFINVYHAVSAAASHFHVTDNDISVPEPEYVPGIAHPGFAIHIEPVPPGPGGTVSSTINVCEHNVIAGNRIEGHPDGIILSARPGTKCRHNVIRDNTIAVHRVRLPASRPYVGPARIISEDDPTVVGVPLALINDPVSWVGDDSAPRGIFEGNLIEGNRITGPEGLGIVVYRASRNRVVNNTIREVTVRYPYPGNTIRPSPREEWDEANGSGIWLSVGSDGNEIVGNTFDDMAASAVYIEGDNNRVKLRSADDAVRDLGSGNRVGMADDAIAMLDFQYRHNMQHSLEQVEQDSHANGIVAWSAEVLKSRAALIYVQHVAFSLTDARDDGRTAVEQGRRVGEVIARYKERLVWHASSDALMANALAKLIEPEYELELDRATFTIRSRHERAARELARYGSSIEEYVAWLQAMHDVIGRVQGYAMTARLDGDWLVEAYGDLPDRRGLEPATNLQLVELSPEELRRYEGVYTGAIVGDTTSVGHTMRVWREDGRLRITTWPTGRREPYGRHLIPLTEGVFLPGWYPEEGSPEVPRNARVRFSPTGAGPPEWVELEVDGGGATTVWRLERVR